MPEVISLKDARAKGEKFYFTGVPCKNGHLSKRRVINTRCFQCETEQGEIHYWATLEHAKEVRTAYRKKNPNYGAEYWATGKGKYGGYKGRAKRNGLSFTLTKEQFDFLVAQPCTYCGDFGGGIDRKDSSKGYDLDNCTPCCQHCNTAKMDRPVEEFLKWIEKISKFHGGQNVK